MAEVRILIIDDDEASRSALRQILDSEGWKVHIQPLASEILNELAKTEWTLFIVNVALTGLSGPVFATLRDLSQAPALESGKRRVRVLFLVPELLAEHAQPLLEFERVPYVMKPLHMHDFLDKVGDLLVEAGAIPRAIRRVRELHGSERRQKERRGAGRNRRESPMFAAREEYYMTEEEIAEYEKQEAGQKKQSSKPPTDLGSPDKNK